MILPRSLWKLMSLRYRASLGRLFSSRSPTRLVFTILGIVVLLAYLLFLAVFVGFRGAPSTQAAADFVPVIMLGLLAMTLGSGGAEYALAFSPAEIDFLFPGPFTRRQLIVYRLVRTVIGAIFASVFFMLFLRAFSATTAQALVGSFLMIVTINLVQTVVALAQQTVAERLVRAGRRVVLALFLCGLGIGIYYFASADVGKAIDLARSAPVKALTYPLRPFAGVMAAGSFAAFAGWFAACAGIISLLVAGVFSLDRLYADAAIDASRKLQTRLERMRRGSGAAGLSDGRLRSRSLPVSGVAGAVFRRQVLAAMRGSRILIAAVIGAGIGALILFRVRGTGGPGYSSGFTIGIMAVMMLPALLKFDFRGDLDQIEYLKTLPARPFEITLGQLAVPTIMILLVEAGILAATGLGRSAIEQAPWSLALLLPGTLIIVGVENLAFLMWPDRQLGPGQSGLALSGRRMMLLLVRLALLMGGGGLVGGAYLAANVATRSREVAAIAAIAAAFTIAGVLVLAVARAFRRFDVSRDLPE